MQIHIFVEILIYIFTIYFFENISLFCRETSIVFTRYVNYISTINNGVAIFSSYISEQTNGQRDRQTGRRDVHFF